MTSTQVTEFEALRPHLMAVAYRVTGTVADAEDIVQEAWLRWDAHDRTTIADLRAWLTTVVSRLGLDRLRSAAHRREAYTGNWLPEPVVTGFGPPLFEADPLSAVVAAEDARFAAMVVLERLSPDQRVAFVLHDGFAVPFAEVADVLGTSEAAARQLASRARKSLAAEPPPPPDPTHNEVVGKLMAAIAEGDLDAVVALLHPDVTLTGDANGEWNAATQAAMQKYQADHGWQTRLLPDSRALKALGLGPDYSTAINAKDVAANNGGAGQGSAPGVPAAQAAGFAAASGVNR